MDDKDNLLVYGVVDNSLVFMRKDRAVSRAQIMEALDSSKTWGDFQGKISQQAYQELMDYIRRRNDRAGAEDDFEVFYRKWQDWDSSVSREQIRLEYEILPPGQRLPFKADVFDVTDIPGFCDGDWPWWPAQEMMYWLPADIQKQYAKRIASTLNGDFLEIDPHYESNIVQALAQRGFNSSKDQDLLNRAHGLSSALSL